MIVRSSPYSFVDFEERPFHYILPVVNLYVMTFQLYFEMETVDWGETFKVQLITPDGSTVLADLPADVGVVENVCSWCKVGGVTTDEAKYPITVNSNQLIPAGVYDTFEDLANAFNLASLEISAPAFLHCCSHGISNHYSVGTSAGDITFDFFPGLQYISFMISADNPLIMQDITQGRCFKYRFVNTTKNQFVDSNVFRYTGDVVDKYIVKAQYNCNEDAYGFGYPPGVYNTVYLPMRFFNPQYPETRQVYKKSNQTFKILSASIESEYDASTNFVTNAVHRRIMVMLAHDNITINSVTVNGAICKKDGEDYDIKWPDINTYDESTLASAEFKIKVPFTGRNSNCEKRLACAFPTETVPPPPTCTAVSITDVLLPDAQASTYYLELIPLSGTAPFTLSSFLGPTWMAAYVESDHVTLYGTPAPDDIGTGLEVSFTVQNCSDSTDSFSQLIDVTPAPVGFQLVPVIENYGNGDVLTVHCERISDGTAVGAPFATVVTVHFMFSLNDGDPIGQNQQKTLQVGETSTIIVGATDPTQKITNPAITKVVPDTDGTNTYTF